MSKLPIKTTYDGEKTTKVCVEDFYKVINRIMESIDKAYTKSMDELNSTHKIYDGYEGELVVGTGVSQPCNGDKYDLETGNEIAFKKAKLNANIKKAKIIERIYQNFLNAVTQISGELLSIEDYIIRDLTDLRKYNKEYLSDFNLYPNFPINNLCEEE